MSTNETVYGEKPGDLRKVLASLKYSSVPAAPVERNFVVNGAHQDFGQLRVIETIGPIYDERI